LKHLILRRALLSIRLPFSSENPRVFLDGLPCDITKNNTFKSPERGRKQERKKGRKGYQNPNKSKLKKIIHFINSHVLFLALVITFSVEGREKKTLPQNTQAHRHT
jgi:hypothetical protein